MTTLDADTRPANPAEVPGVRTVTSRNPVLTGFRRGLRGMVDAATVRRPVAEFRPHVERLMLTRTMFGLMLFGAVLAWDRFGAAAPHKAPPPVLAKPHAVEPVPVWDVVIGDGYIRGRTVITPNREKSETMFAEFGTAESR